MLIAFASKGKTINDELSEHFGRTEYYIFIDSETKNVEKIEENPCKYGHSPGEIPEFIKLQKADVIISGGMGPRAIDWFEKLGIKAITSEIKPIKDVLKDYLDLKLTDVKSCK